MTDEGCVAAAGDTGPSDNKTICDRSMYVNMHKHYNCSVSDQDIINLMDGFQGAAIATTSFANNSQTNGNATLAFFWTSSGTPLLFACNFTQCEKTIDFTGTQRIYCLWTTCNITTYTSPILSEYIEKAATTMTFTCTPDGVCQWSQAELASVIPYIALQCGGGECTQVYVPVIQPPTAYSRILFTLAIGIATLIFGTVVSIGAYKILKEKIIHKPAPHIEATLSFHNVSCSIRQSGYNRVILHPTNGAILPGRLTAILGASGAGKTTFLDILARRKNTGKINGEVLINGDPCVRSFKRLVGYVTQDDVFLGTLTVREYLLYIAKLRLPGNMNDVQKANRVDECLYELGIFHVANSRIGTDTTRGISGGERKRLAIAVELVVNPSILLLDEPTSGLDSHSASSLVQTLEALAHGKNKRTIIMSIHQPRSDIYHMLDYLMVFAAGHVVYFGETHLAVSHFASLGYECQPNFNPADFIIDTVSLPEFLSSLSTMAAQTPKQFEKLNGSPAHNGHGNGYTNGHVSGPKPHENIDEYAVSFFTQYRLLCHRTFLNSLRNPFLLRIQYTVFVVVGLLLGYLYWHISDDLRHGGMQNRMGSLFFLCTLLSFASITSIDLFFSERLLFLRERANGCYRTSAYFLAKATSDLIPMRLIPPLILGATVYYMIGFQPVAIKFAIFLYTLVVLSMTATSMCFLISSLAPSIAVGNFIAILLLFFFLLFGGFLVALPSMPDAVRWVTNLSFLTFSYSVLMVNEFEGIKILINPDGMNEPNPINIDGTFLLTQVGMTTDSLYPNMAILVGMLGFYLVASYLALRFVVKEKR